MYSIVGAGAETPPFAEATEGLQLGRGFPQGILSANSLPFPVYEDYES